MFRFKTLDLQAKVIMILIVVILPISLLLTLAQSRLLAPLLYEEMRQVGLSFAQTLVSQIESNQILSKPNAPVLLEDHIQRSIYTQPSVLRVDVYGFSNSVGKLVNLASSVEDAENTAPPITALVEHVTTEMSTEEGAPIWSILYPVKMGSYKANVHVLMSLRLVTAIQSTILKFNVIAALVSTILLILLLSFFLRRVIDNEKQLKVAQMSNEVLSEKLQEIQQELIHKERLAVMGQLTASFAHEIGTPLNAIGGHMQLLTMDLEKSLPAQSLKGINDRMSIIVGQLKKIEQVVKGFLSRTKTPVPEQRSLTSVKELIEKVLVLVTPTLQRHLIAFSRDFQASDDRVEVVPIEIEQVTLNLINNAIDSMKNQKDGNSLVVRTRNDETKKWLHIEVQDTGSGITEDNFKRIFKPFFTTKATGEGHGLGLSICQEIIRSYGGEIVVDSALEKGTTVRVQLPIGGAAKVTAKEIKHV